MTMWFAKRRNKTTCIRTIAVMLLVGLVMLVLAASLVSLHECGHDHCHLCLLQKGVFTLLLIAVWYSSWSGSARIVSLSAIQRKYHTIKNRIAMCSVRLNC